MEDIGDADVRNRIDIPVRAHEDLLNCGNLKCQKLEKEDAFQPHLSQDDGGGNGLEEEGIGFRTREDLFDCGNSKCHPSSQCVIIMCFLI